MKYIKSYEHLNFYKIVELEFLICDTDACAKSDRTFDIKFSDFAKNKELQSVLNICENTGDIENFAVCLSSFGSSFGETSKYDTLMTDPILRILVQDYDLFIRVLAIFSPNDIRVIQNKYNL
jgi:3-deoxy-D-manno-octulosonic acid (KDO) 8-phosphate synthase